MKQITIETLIIGAGPAGMACAMELSKKDKRFLILERDSSVGGLAKTYSFPEKDGLIFYTDNGPHRFFSKNPYLYEFIGELVKKDWISVHRQTRQYLGGKFYDYPINAMQALKNVGIFKASRMLIDYFIAKVQYAVFKKPIKNFEDYVVANFGRTLGEFNMINYTEKIWGISAREIHPDWAKQRIKGLDLRAVIKDLFQRTFSKSKNTPKSLVDTFYYPYKGTGQIYETIKELLIKKGYQVLLNAETIKISKTSDGFLTKVKDEHHEDIEIKSKYLVESVPVKEFIALLAEQTPNKISQAIKKLRYRSQVYLFVTINKESLTKDQWIYFPDKKVPIGRVSEMKNFSDYMSPPGKTSLFIEFFCFENDEIWNMSKDELFEYALPWCEKAGLFTHAEVRNYYRIEKKNVYPIYDIKYQEYLNVVKDYLENIPNLFFIGRPGRFRYNNQDHSLEMGIMAAQSIIDGKKYDIESVGEEKEYFESGKVYQKPVSE